MKTALLVLVGAVGLAVISAMPASAVWDEDQSPGEQEKWSLDAGNACPEVFFVGLRGSGQNGPGKGPLDFGKQIESLYEKFSHRVHEYPVEGSVLGARVAPLPPDGYEAVSANPFTVTDEYWDSMHGGAAALVKAIKKSWKRCGMKSRFVLAGFSQGAHSITLALHTIPQVLHKQIDAIVLLASPVFTRRYEGDMDYAGSYDSGANGSLLHGVSNGEIPEWAWPKTLAYCNDGDFVCGGNVGDVRWRPGGGWKMHATYSAVELNSISKWASSKLKRRRLVAVPSCLTGALAERATHVGTSGADIIRGTGRNDVVKAYGGDDTIKTHAGRDLVCAGLGSDTVHAGGGNDRVYGQAGADPWLSGGGGSDTVRGGSGDDRIDGGYLDDHLYGGDGNDNITGGLGDDTIDGGPGNNDLCDGEEGNNTVVNCETTEPPPGFCDTQSAVPVAECEALETLYNDTDGPNWFDATGWLIHPDVCRWYGVTCASGTVVQLSLGANDLLGPTPRELEDLTNLEVLSFSGNSLSGRIPAELGNLQNLIQLQLGGNALSGSIPAELGNLQNLEDLNLTNNSLSGPIPAELGNLQNLRYLAIFHNAMSGPIPAELGNLQNLIQLQLGDNALSGSIPAELGNLQNLRWLIIGQNSLSGSIPAELGSLPNLSDLTVSFNSLSGSIPAELGSLPNVSRLLLSFNSLSGEVPPELMDLEDTIHDYSLGLRGQDGCLTASGADLSAWLDRYDLLWNDGC